MAAILAPLTSLASTLLPSNKYPGAAETTATSLNATTPVPNDEGLFGETETRGIHLNIIATVPTVPDTVAPTRVTWESVQTMSTQTEDTGLQSPTTTVITAGTTGRYGTLPRGSLSHLPVPEKTKHQAAAHTENTRDLPSYTTPKLSHPGAVAALLAHNSHKPVEIWRPGPIAAAGAAASLAHANPKRLEILKVIPATPAGKAVLSTLEGRSPQPYQISEISKRCSLGGAIGAMQRARRRSGSSPIHLSTRQASTGDNALTSIANAHMPSQDKRRSDILRAATVSMSRSNCNTLPPDAHGHKALVQPDLHLPATTPPSRRYNKPNIEEAARKVAAERLAKIGYDADIPCSTSLLGAQASVNRSYTVASSSDLGRIRKMALPQNNLASADAKKYGENAVLLMSTAQRNVQARLSGIDKQVAESRGLIRRGDWDAKAIEVAQAGSDKRMKHHGKVSIGGGAYMSPEEIDTIAERNVQPVLDEINRNVEAERARLEVERAGELEARLELKESKRVQDLQRARGREAREDIKRAKGPELSEICLKAIEKEGEKRRKEEEKRTIKERKQLEKIDSKRRRESMGVGGATDMHLPQSSDNSGGGIRGLINRFRRRHSRQISLDEKIATANNVPESSQAIPAFSGGHRAVVAEQQQQQKSMEANGNVSPRPPASRIPRPVSALAVSRVGDATITPGSIRAVAIIGAPPPVMSGSSNTEVRRRHSLSSVGSTGHRFRGRKRGDVALSSWTVDQNAKKGKGKLHGKTGRDFSKANGRIVSPEDYSEYLDEARDTFSQQPTTLNRPTSGYFPQEERRFSAGETSMSSRFRENL